MADYTGAGIFSEARRANADEQGIVSQFVNARLAESSARAQETAPPPQKVPPLVAAVMRGNAQIQSVTREKGVQETMATALSRMKITEHGDGTIDVKGAPAEFFEGKSLAAEGKSAVEEPHAKVDQALAGSTPTAPVVPPVATIRPEEVTALEGMYEANDTTWGQRLPRPYEVEELVKTPEGVRKLTALLGGTEEHARINIKRAQRPESRQILAANLTRNLVKFHAGQYETNKSAITDQEQAGRANLEALKESRRVVNSFLDNRIEGYATADDAVETIRQHVIGSGLPWNDAIEKEARAEYAAKAELAANGASKAVFGRISAMKDDDIKGYDGDAERWIADTEGSLGVTFSPEQRSAATARFSGISKEVADAQRKVEIENNRKAISESLAARREAMQAAKADREVEIEARKARNEARTVTQAAMRDRDAKVNAALKKLDDLDTQIRKNSLRYASDESKEAEKKELQNQNRTLVAQIPVEQDKLYIALGYELVTQEEYDRMIASGETKQSIAADKIRISKQSQRSANTPTRERRVGAHVEFPLDPNGKDENSDVLSRVPPSRFLPERFKNARNVTYGTPTTKQITINGKPEPQLHGLFGRAFDPRKSPNDAKGLPRNTALISAQDRDETATYAHETFHSMWVGDLRREERASFQHEADVVLEAFQKDLGALLYPANGRTALKYGEAVAKAADKYPKAIVTSSYQYQGQPERMYDEMFSELGGQYIANPKAFKKAYPALYGWYRKLVGREFIDLKAK